MASLPHPPRFHCLCKPSLGHDQMVSEYKSPLDLNIGCYRINRGYILCLHSWLSCTDRGAVDVKYACVKPCNILQLSTHTWYNIHCACSGVESHLSNVYPSVLSTNTKHQHKGWQLLIRKRRIKMHCGQEVWLTVVYPTISCDIPYIDTPYSARLVMDISHSGQLNKTTLTSPIRRAEKKSKVIGTPS